MREKVSSPLLPRSPEILPHIPSSDTGRLDLLSEHSSPTRQEQLHIEQRMLDEDTIIAGQHSDEMLQEIEGLGEMPLPSPEFIKQPLQSSESEQPISPRQPERRPPGKKKTVSWNEDLTEILRGSSPGLSKPEDISSDDIDALFEESVCPTGTETNSEVERRQRREVDSSIRVPVPTMDSSLPIPPWEATSTLHRRNSFAIFKRHFWKTTPGLYPAKLNGN